MKIIALILLSIPSLAQVVTVDGKVVPSKVIDMTNTTIVTGTVDNVALILKPKDGKKYTYTITEVPVVVVPKPVTIEPSGYTSAIYKAVDLNAAKTKVTLRYALATGTGKVTINVGTYSTTADLTSTGTWTTFSDKIIPIVTDGGIKDISITTTTPTYIQSLKLE